MVFLAILAGGVGARALLEPAAPQAKPAAALPAPAAAGSAELPTRAEAPLGKTLARLERPPAPLASGNARVELAVAPWGEVLVDGHSRGVSPPLRVLEVVPGAHTVEIRNSDGEIVFRFDSPNRADSSLSPRQDYCHFGRFTLPNLPPGAYTLWLKATDVPTGRSARRSLDFRVGSPKG